MANLQFICINGEYARDNQPVIFHTNRAFKFGDCLFETIHANNCATQFLELHFKRLAKGMKLLGMELPAGFTPLMLEGKINRLLKANKLFKGARVRLSVFRDSDGLYTPTSNKIGYLIEASGLPGSEYALNEKGLVIDLFPDMEKQASLVSNCKTTNSLLFVLAGIYKSKHQLDDCLIVNNRGDACETISSNIFAAKGETIFTPSLESGCVGGVMRETTIVAARKLGFEVFDSSVLKPADLLMADELFLTNAITGIRWVVAFRNKRYYNKASTKLTDKINEMAFGQG